MSEHNLPAVDWQEWRRVRAWELSQQGWKQRDIAMALDVTPGAVSQWLKRAREQGLEALRHRVAVGPPPRLTPEQLRQIPALLQRGARAYGFPSNQWTNQRIAKLLEQIFGVHYHPTHIRRLLRRAAAQAAAPESDP